MKRYIILFLYVSVICVFAGSAVAANTVIPYTLTTEWTPPIMWDNGWTYLEYSPGTLWLTANPSGGIIASIDVPTGIGGEGGGLGGSRHYLPDYSLHNHGFIQLEYSSFSSEMTGNPEGVELCLEIMFHDADNVDYEMAIVVLQDAGGSFLGTWFDIGGGPYYTTPVPDGLSITEGALGLYSNGSLVFPYFMDATGSVVSPFVVWNVSGITGTKDYRVDNDFEGTTTAGGTIIASVNLEQVVYTQNIVEPLYGWVYIPQDVPDLGYSLAEGDLVYFYSSEPVLNYNITAGQWETEGPKGWLYVDWPFIYESDPGILWFAYPPESGLWVYHFSTNQWELLPQIIPW